MNRAPLPPVLVVLPDGQELNGLLHARLQTQRAWMYQVSLPTWQVTADEWVEPAQYMVWVPADYVRLLEGIVYDDVPAQGLAPAVDAPTQRLEPVPAATPVVEAVERAGAWRIERLPRERGRPGWNVVHVHDCEDADDGDILDLDQALTVVRQPGTRVCTKCGAAETLPPLM
ncbi:DUF6233 domain-containing protein [Streptomyces sp. NBC_01210]|uniref:DUF6233 domain-containing protein n=1 Tax=Streptomyces sp. NBC_01210 TaxID=2903774 RepID=UPI002E155D52|nr:DUF6233 domain-containing protein [Streptomyces sp. NBC_01210]